MSGLTLRRRIGESIVLRGDGHRIDSAIKVTVTRLQGGTVWLALDAPDDVHILREELLRPDQEGDPQWQI